MKHLLVVLMVAPFATLASAETPKARYGPAKSPLAWQEVATAKLDSAASFFPRRDFVGVAKAPSSVKVVALDDQTPFGETRHRTVWLARYESISVKAPDGNDSAPVPLSLAIDADTGHLVCAFTDPASQSVQPAREWGPWVLDVEARAKPSGSESARLHAS